MIFLRSRQKVNINFPKILNIMQLNKNTIYIHQLSALPVDIGVKIAMQITAKVVRIDSF